jgi:hypothetical protein
MHAVEEARGRVKGGALKGSLDGFQSGWLCGHRLGHVQVRALSLQLGLAGADCVLSSFFESGSARGDVEVDALLQPVHVIGSGEIGLLGVLCVSGIFGVMWCSLSCMR